MIARSGIISGRITEGIEVDNLNAEGRPLKVLRVRASDIDLDEPQRIPECIELARKNVQEQIESGEVGGA